MALSGMTGFGRSEGAQDAWTWAVEARSVNGRNLEVRFRGPPGFESIEKAARDGAQIRFHRGSVNIGVQARRIDAGQQVRVNMEQLDRYLELGEPLLATGRATVPSLDGLLALRGVVEVAEGDDDPQALARLTEAMTASLAVAMDELLAVRREEGAAIGGLLTGLLERIEGLVREAAGLAEGQPAAIKERFERRMRELAGESAVLEDRIIAEAAAFAVKADVREEIDRLAEHVRSARALIGAEGPAGRRLDFLTQEFMREANTLCSKSALSPLTSVGLDLKATIEQFREQVQNVE